MEDIFNMLSSTARIDKSKSRSKRKKNKNLRRSNQDLQEEGSESNVKEANFGEQDDDDYDQEEAAKGRSRDRTGKRDTSDEKMKLVHKEQIAAFRRSMCIRLANKHDPDTPDPISSFRDLTAPSWWNSPSGATGHFQTFWRPMLGNIEAGRWKEPTPIQMQAIPTLLRRRDFIGAAPTGSGKSGAFLLPALLLSSAPRESFYRSNNDGDFKPAASSSKKKSKKKHTSNCDGGIRALVVAPTLELAAQLHREVERLGLGKPAGVSSLLLSRSNAANVNSGSAGGKHGLDVLVATPLRLVDSIEKGIRLDDVRIIVMDEADRLLDAADGTTSKPGFKGKEDPDDNSDADNDASDNKKFKDKHRKQGKIQTLQSGSTQTKSFLAQMDVILSQVPASAVRALFSATVTPMVRSLAESVLRNPVDVTIAASGTNGGANTDIDQQLMFVGKEEGKLLAMRQLAQRGQIKPPVIVFTQSQDRAQALFAELLYDGIHVDVIHAGRSKAARDNAVAKFRRGDTWVLIATDLVARGVDFKSINMVINYDLPVSGISYVHRIGRTGRAGRKGTAITLFTEADFENLRTIANVMRQSGCKVEDWMLNLKRNDRKDKKNPRRYRIDTTPRKRKRMNHDERSKQNE